MTKEELAARLTGREYRDEITAAEEAEARAAGLVVVFGASDDLMEFEGAIRDEIGCYDGGTAMVDENGLLDRDQIDDSAANLCVEHCRFGQQSADHASAPTVPAALLTTLYTLPVLPEPPGHARP